MQSEEFISIRKKLSKTQKQLSELLGTSLKAVSSYEQGWRAVPGHVERQLLFLLSRKQGEQQSNCWDIISCPEEKKQQCPAWEFNAGSLCWFINGTLCNEETRRYWQEKITICRKCPAMSNLLSF